MKKAVVAMLCGLWFCASGAQALDAKDGWVTFKTGRNGRGMIEHQIERRSIKQEGRYKSFWTRIWLVKEKQALVFSVNEQLFFWSQKFLVDCAGRRFGAGFVDSVQPKDMRQVSTEATMRWESLDKFPAVAKTVCGEK